MARAHFKLKPNTAGIDYLLHPQILGTVEESVRADQIIPVVVLSEEEISAGPEKLWDTLHYLVDNDDVCTDEFTGIIVVRPSPTSASAPDEPLKIIVDPASDRSASVYHLSPGPNLLRQGEEAQLPSGPYFLSGRNLHQAWRLYPDDLDAFTFGLLPDDPYSPKSFQAVALQSWDGLARSIPVPSRLYHKPDSDRPLAGARVSVKDIFDIQGVKTTLSSRAWAELYPAATTNAPYLKRLLDQGAIIVGKTKTTQFATGAEWVDFQAPVNPRGDRYQYPSGSSTGAAASLAGYPWLDHSIGGDSAGSVRGPATYHGLHALRPTFGSASLDGIKIMSPRYDTVGIFGRSLNEIAFIVENSLDVTQDEDKTLPRKLILPADFFPLTDTEHQRLFDQFVGILETYIGVERVTVNLTQIWEENPPVHPHGAGQSLHEFMKKAPTLSLCYDYYHVSEQFRCGYREEFGREPFVEASPRHWWNVGANVTKHEYDMYVRQIGMFKAWFDTTVMRTDRGHLQDGIMFLPNGIAGPKYRDAIPEAPSASEGIDPQLLSPLLATPHLVVCFAQVPYESRVSGSTEYRPICAGIMSARGSDLALLRLVHEALEMAGWRADIDSGRYTYPLGNNSRNVDDGLDDKANQAETFIEVHIDSMAHGHQLPVDEL
ncbi:hypothetical protein M406DRAFT_106416 [Cryphonectria parasitica EP155]|uniref:Amidase domain-containing protein n=1 Tax=Cryphonectria parasitica (strain ATCC 38755 / EP155) TaxID=660469 RepID=A0A9P5CR00_CRYP1|nr:uncharacterized protein M406DRAFT_106416 [Cryphonectria parasitica EP155]KAF3767012.1 hypothetical protein M406DRAFT_106416 [Cryphonectria parasitica EP155]